MLSTEAWTKLFAEHPLMRRFSSALAWGICNGDTLAKSFRCRENGLFYDAEGKELELPEDVRIRLVFPLELTKEE